MSVYKKFQRRLYTFLSTRWAIACFVVGFLLISTTFLHITVVVFTRMYHFRNLSDLIALIYQTVGDQPIVYVSHEPIWPPIDIVYTWVNGSDPRLIDCKFSI